MRKNVFTEIELNRRNFLHFIYVCTTDYSFEIPHVHYFFSFKGVHQWVFQVQSGYKLHMQ